MKTRDRDRSLKVLDVIPIMDSRSVLVEGFRGSAGGLRDFPCAKFPKEYGYLPVWEEMRMLGDALLDEVTRVKAWVPMDRKKETPMKENKRIMRDRQGKTARLIFVLGALVMLMTLGKMQVSEAAAFPLTLSLQGMGIGELSGVGTIDNQSTNYSGAGWGAGLLATLHLSDSWAIRGQGNFIRLTGTPAIDLVPVTLGVQYTFLNVLDLISLYALGDAGYNYGTSYGGQGNSFVWDAGIGMNVGIFYAEVRYEAISGPLLTTNNTSLGSISFVPIVVGFTFL